jgi:hypothetical protein
MVIYKDWNIIWVTNKLILKIKKYIEFQTRLIVKLNSKKKILSL